MIETHANLLDESNRDDWNRFVAGSKYGHTLQSWEWGVVRERTGWEVERLALIADAQICAAAQVLIRNLPYGFGRLAYVPKGPAVDYGDQALVKRTIEALGDIAQERRVSSLKIEPEVPESPLLFQQLVELGLRPASPVQMRSTIWVDLTASEEEMLGRQKQKTRYNIRLAAKRGVIVRSGALSELDAWYGMYEETAQRDRFTIHARDYYQQVLETLQPAGLANLLLAFHEEDLLAGIIVFCFGSQAQYMYGASSNRKRNLMAPHLLQWEGMRWAKGKGASVYDLWGIPDRLEESEDLWGVYRHKRGYGGEIVRYIGALDIVRSPLQHLALEKVARPLFKRVARLTP